jgi:hypothetical protein
MPATDLCSVEQVREFLQKQVSDVTQDPVILSLIGRASRAITRLTQREFTPTTAATRTFRTTGRFVDLSPYDIRTATQVRDLEGPTVLDTDEYLLLPLPSQDGTYFMLELYGSGLTTPRFKHRRVEVTGDWGFADVPADVEHACIVTVATWLRRDVAAFSTTFSIDEARLERPEALPFAVARSLDSYKRVIA